MEASQITIISIIFLIDFIQNIIYPIHKNMDKINEVMLQMIRILFVYTLLVSSVIYMNQLREVNKGNCPEYEKLENVYQKKINYE